MKKLIKYLLSCYTLATTIVILQYFFMDNLILKSIAATITTGIGYGIVCYILYGIIIEDRYKKEVSQ